MTSLFTIFLLVEEVIGSVIFFTNQLCSWRFVRTKGKLSRTSTTIVRSLPVQQALLRYVQDRISRAGLKQLVTQDTIYLMLSLIIRFWSTSQARSKKTTRPAMPLSTLFCEGSLLSCITPILSLLQQEKSHEKI